MNTTPLITVLMLCVTLIGCAAQQPARTSTGWTKAEVDVALAAAVERCNQRLSDSQIDPLRPHINISNIEDSTVQQMGSKQKPTPVEKDAILAWDDAQNYCQTELTEVYKVTGMPPRLLQNYQDLWLLQKQAKAKLWAGQITYGTYINESVTNRRGAAERNRAFWDGVKATELQQAQVTAQQRQATAQTLMMFNQAAGLYRQPVQTNCVKIGGQTSCTSY